MENHEDFYCVVHMGRIEKWDQNIGPIGMSTNQSLRGTFLSSLQTTGQPVLNLLFALQIVIVKSLKGVV